MSPLLPFAYCCHHSTGASNAYHKSRAIGKGQQIIQAKYSKYYIQRPIYLSKTLSSHHLTAELNLPPLHGEPGGLGGLGLVKVQVLVLGDLAAVLERQHLDTGLASDQVRGRLGANGALAVASRGTHADDGGVCPAERAAATGDHGIALQLVDGVLLFLEAAPVADWVEAAGVDDLVESEHADLGVVLGVAWVG